MQMQMQIQIKKTSDFIDFIKKARYDKHLSQSKLGQMCGLKQQYIYQIESGKVVPNLKTMLKIVEALGYEISLWF